MSVDNQNQFEPLLGGEVLSVDESAQLLLGNRTFRVEEFVEAIRMQLEDLEGWTQDKNAWFSEKGIPAEVLRFTAKGWQKGTVRISLEFVPEETESQKSQNLKISNTSQEQEELPIMGMMG
ncbi:MAG: KGK domain-containing protein [Coleofasciculus sp. G3-WIS-01]|uniref:KGK domain-containing protein n=1 Tax=Coleofasciculus sp. G3-WIS-01 TaxID=3069528 RepID=UPI00330211D7